MRLRGKDPESGNAAQPISVATCVRSLWRRSTHLGAGRPHFRLGSGGRRAGL